MHESLSERIQVTRKIESVKHVVATAITDEFFLAHPEWDARYGDRGRQRCTEDTCFHLDFLSGALEAGSPESFADYARWTARMPQARGIGAHTFDENLAQLERRLSAHLLTTERSIILTFFAGARAAIHEPASFNNVASVRAELAPIRQVFLMAILTGRRSVAMTIVDEALKSGLSHEDLYVDIFAEALHRVGALWEGNQIGVAQEHIATSITQYAIASIYPRLAPATVNLGSMVVTGLAGELHQVGANLVADSMEARGWSVRFFGTNLPHSSIVSSVEDCAADVLCISTTIVSNLPAVRDLVAVVRAKLKDRAPRIVLGGGAYLAATSFAEDLGAIGPITTLRRGLELLCS